MPFHGKRENNFDFDDIGGLNWCERNMKLYLEQMKAKGSSTTLSSPSSRFDAEVEKRYLERVLEVAKKNGGHTTTNRKSIIVIDDDKKASSVRAAINLDHSDASSSDDGESDDLEEPYTQAMATHDSDDDLRNFRRRKERKCIEPIRPGDVVEYYNPIFVHGR